MKTLITLVIGFGLLPSSFVGSTTKAAKTPPISAHVYKIDPEVFVSHLKHLVPPLAGESNQKLLVRFIRQQHIKLPTHSSIVLNEEEGSLWVTTAQAAQDKIRMVVQKILATRVVEENKDGQVRLKKEG